MPTHNLLLLCSGKGGGVILFMQTTEIYLFFVTLQRKLRSYYVSAKKTNRLISFCSRLFVTLRMKDYRLCRMAPDREEWRYK